MKDTGTPYRLEMRADFLSSTEEVSHLSKAPQEEFSLRNMCVRGTLCFLLQGKWTPRCPDWKEVQIFLKRFHACSLFISQDERMSASPVETLQKALGLHFISKWCLRCLWQLESHVEFTASNLDNAWQFFNIVSNPNITVSNRKRDLNSHLTSRSIPIVLPHLVYIPDFSLIPRQVSWLHWTNSSFEWTSPP